MDRSMHIRLDDETAAAVAELRARGENPSDVVRRALRTRAHGGSSDRHALADHLDAWAEPDDTELWERFLLSHHDGVVPIVRARSERTVDDA
ncbi:MAG: hypothetical protein ACR2JV_01055 [Gaiellales bacterium]